MPAIAGKKMRRYNPRLHLPTEPAPMLEDIREKKTNRITYLLVIIAGIGMLFIGVPYFNHGGETNIATVNGQEVPLRAYQEQYRDIQQQQPDLSETDLKQRAVRSLVERTLFQQQALNSRYRLPDSALYRIIKEQFGNDENYQQWLKSRGISAETYQKSVRSDQSIASYYSALQAAGGENNPLYQHYLQSAAQERGYTLYTIPRAPIAAAINVDDSALQKHYEAHGERYATPETVDINYTIYDIADLPVSDEQIAKARAASERRGGRYLIIDDAKAASDAAAAIKDGRKTFADYWQDIQNKTLAGESGELALAAKGKGTSPELDEALFALAKPGDVSPLIDSEYGKILVELGNIETGNRSDEELRRLAASENETAYTEHANQAFDAAQNGKGLAAITGITGGQTQSLSAITADSDAAPWLHEPKIQAQLFGAQALPDNKVGEPVEIGPQRTLFFTVSKREKPQPRPFAGVRAQVETDYRNEQANTTLHERGDALKQALAESPEKAAALASEYQAKSETVAPANRYTTQNPLVLELFNQSARISSLDTPDGDLLVARLDSVRDGDPAQLPEPVRQTLTQAWQMQAISGDYKSMGDWLYRQAKISVNEEALQR